MTQKLQNILIFPSGLTGIFLNNLWFCGHNFGTRNARKSIKPSKDSYYNLCSFQ